MVDKSLRASEPRYATAAAAGDTAGGSAEARHRHGRRLGKVYPVRALPMDLRVAKLFFRPGGVRYAAGDDLILLTKLLYEIQLNLCTNSSADCDEFNMVR
jgi:hypothetical protein